MVDLRSVEVLSKLTLTEAEYWRNSAFVWKRWGPSSERREHAHFLLGVHVRLDNPSFKIARQQS